MSELEQLLSDGPVAVLNRLRAAGSALDTPSWWLRLAEGCGVRANTAFDRGAVSQGLAWVRCGVETYDGLAERSSDANPLRQSSMVLRVRAVRECGATAGDEVLDPQRIFAWAREALTLPLDEAVAFSASMMASLANAGHRLPTMLRVREMKNRLNALEWLGPAVDLPADLRPWFEAKKRLI